ncbi:MAG: carboxymuconolactone decarboxylase family protein, partial [Desulfobacterales bacterium]|nr:carboxymuconolactone decarboxylase family protein [Desulfobacterales bacterium]
GVVPNLFRVFGNSPAALEGYLNFSGALAGGVLSAKVREQIALAVAEINDCAYCRSAHTFIGGKVGLTELEIADARRVAATDEHTAAILNLARSIVVQRGELSENEFKAARAASLTDAEIIETTANVGLNILTNYVNHVAQTVVDFPEVKPGAGEATPAAPAAACSTDACGCA